MGRSPLEAAVLAIAAAVALALGGLWWTGTAPPPAGPVAAPWPRTLTPTVTPTVIATVIGEAGTYPNPAEILQFDVAQVERILPERDGVLRQEAGVLTDGGTVDYSGPVPAGAELLLEVACVGNGALEIEIVTPDGAGHVRQVGCDGAMATLEFTAGSTGQALILLVARTTRFVGIAVQLVQA